MGSVSYKWFSKNRSRISGELILNKIFRVNYGRSNSSKIKILFLLLAVKDAKKKIIWICIKTSCHLCYAIHRQKAEKKIYIDDFLRFYKWIISLSNVSIFEMNIKEAYTEHIAVQTSRIDSPHETTWKALNKHGFKKSIIVFNVIPIYVHGVTLGGSNARFGTERCEVPPLQIVSRVDCARVKLTVWLSQGTTWFCLKTSTVSQLTERVIVNKLHLSVSTKYCAILSNNIIFYVEI